MVFPAATALKHAISGELEVYCPDLHGATRSWKPAGLDRIKNHPV